MSIFSVFIIFLAAILQSTTGFGFSLVAIPILALIFDPHVVIPLVMLSSFITICLNIKNVYKESNRDLLKRLLVGGFIGIPFGAFVYYTFDVRSLKILVSITILFFAVILLSEKFLKKFIEKYKNKAWLVGIVSGFLTTSVGIPGPPIMLFLSALKEEQSRYRATGLVFLFYIYPVCLLILLMKGSFTLPLLKLLILFIPASFLGVLLGNKFHRKISPQVFKILTYIIIVTSGLYSLISNL